MKTSNLIPNGRTSRIKKGETSLQVQTEYAYRPYPRLTTTVLNDGQVLHKIEKKLDRPIESVEEQSEIERMIKRQHSDVVSIIEENAAGKPTTLQALKSSSSGYLTLTDRLKAIPGVQRTYDLDNEGNFLEQSEADQFKKAYAALFKGIRDLIEIFAAIPGISMTREKGVLEIERDRLYLVSCGDEICVVTIRPTADNIAYEAAIKKAVDDYFAEG
ncbi:MAG: hypothetical protein JSV52_06325 [Candidatus Zixiibacteriota bacterium]|nr:MAG: hypothetical protein JSV52_06325 [candidate division Zixibacteria bacterium]